MICWWCFEHFQEQKSHSGDPVDLQKSSYVHHWIRLFKTLHLNTDMTIFGVMNFLKKNGTIGRSHEVSHHRLNHRMLYQSSYSHFPIRWIFRKFDFWCLFWGSFNEKICDPLKRTGKIELVLLPTLLKIVHKDVSSFFPKIRNNCQNHGLLKDVVMERRIYPTRR